MERRLTVLQKSFDEEKNKDKGQLSETSTTDVSTRTNANEIKKKAKVVIK